jgi:hypothetical protein
MLVTLRTFAAALIALVVLAASTPLPAAAITVDLVVGREAVAADRQAYEDLSPLPGRTYVDTLTVTAPPVTAVGGDTVNYRVRLREPLRFAVGPNIVTGVAGTTGGVGFRFFLQTSAPATSTGTTPFAGGPVMLTDPENVATPASPTSGNVDADATAQTVFDVRVAGGFGGRTFLADPTRPGLFSGYQGSFTLPPAMPPTTFDRLVSLGVSASLRADDPPPPLIYITELPEPATGGLAIALVWWAGRRRR